MGIGVSGDWNEREGGDYSPLEELAVVEMSGEVEKLTREISIRKAIICGCHRTPVSLGGNTKIGIVGSVCQPMLIHQIILRTSEGKDRINGNGGESRRRGVGSGRRERREGEQNSGEENDEAMGDPNHDVPLSGCYLLVR